MSNNTFEDRQRALENAFFARQNEALLQKMREADLTRSRKAALSAASGITDDAVLQQLAALDLSSQTLAALALVPVVLVAWADGSLDPKEKAAIHDAAREVGLESSLESRELLDSWLKAPPGRELADAWRSYVQAIAAGMTPEGRASLKQETIGRARRVAEAAGGFLGLGNRVSDAEERLLATLEGAFQG